MIELIVVIAIVLVLAALLFPVATGAKARASEIPCVSNLRQIHAALHLYAADHGEYPPNSLSWPALKTYYPTQLRCLASKERYPEYDYEVVAAPLGEPLSETRKAHVECREKRGTDIPIVVDSNHTWKREGSKYIFVRDNGSIAQKPVGSKPLGACDPLKLTPPFDL